MPFPRGVLFAFALVACSGSSKPAPVPPEPAPASTCDTAAAHAATLLRSEFPDQQVDPATLVAKCVEEGWTPEVIACVLASTTADGARPCFAAMIASTPMCTALTQLLAAGADGTFTSIQTPTDDEEPDEYASTVSVPGSTCIIDMLEYPVIVRCPMILTSDLDQANQLYTSVAGSIDGCLTSIGWTGTVGATDITWADPGPDQRVVRVLATQLSETSYTIEVVVEAKLVE
jgi:hypothetical protein